MPNWKKVITSGSDGAFNEITASGVVDLQSDVNTGDIIIGNNKGLYYISKGASATNLDFASTKIEFKPQNLNNFEVGSTGVIVNPGGNNIVFNVRGDNTKNLITTDANNDSIFIGYGNTTPSSTHRMHIEGDVSASGHISSSDIIIDNIGSVSASIASIQNDIPTLQQVTTAGSSTTINPSFNGGIQVGGTASFNGQTRLGNQITDRVNMTARWASGTDILPSVDNNVDFGASALRYKSGHFVGLSGSNVAAGTFSVTSNATIGLNLYMGGNLTVMGNSTIGSNDSDTVAINARVTTDILPYTNGSFELGESGNRFGDLWLTDIGSVSSSIATIESDFALRTAPSNASASAGNGLKGGGSLTGSFKFDVGQGKGMSVTSNAVGIRNLTHNQISSSNWNYLVNMDQDVATTDDVTFATVTASNGIEVSGDILPTSDNTLSLGSTSNRFQLNGGTPVTVTGSGTSNQITRFNGATEVEDSTIENTDTLTTIRHNNDTNDIFIVSGSNGELLKVTDEIGDQLLQVNDGSGITHFEVSSSGTLVAQNLTYNNETFILTYNSASGDINFFSSSAITGDNLGDHTATQDLDMGTNNITNVGNVDGVDVSQLQTNFNTLDGKSLVSSSAQVDLANVVGDTDDVTEGSSNLYYTDTRVKTKLNADGVISGSSQVSFTGISNKPGGLVSASAQISINSTSGTLTTLGTVTSGDVSGILPSGVVSGSVTSPSQGTLSVNGNNVDLGLQAGDSPTFTNLTLTGDLTVTGTTTELQVSELNVQDKNITVASGAANSSAADGAGLTIDGANESLTWNHANSRFQFSDDLHVDGLMNIGSVSNAGTDTDKFLVLDSNGNVDFRTGNEVRSDIGAGTMTRFVLEDGDGTEVVIDDSKEVKFVEGNPQININWTDTSNGSDTDPYDLTFSIAGGVLSGSQQIASDISGAFASTSASIASDIQSITTGKIAGQGAQDEITFFKSSGAITSSIRLKMSENSGSGNVLIHHGQLNVINDPTTTGTPAMQILVGSGSSGDVSNPQYDSFIALEQEAATTVGLRANGTAPTSAQFKMRTDINDAYSIGRLTNPLGANTLRIKPEIIAEGGLSITGSLTISGSNTLKNIGPAEFSGSIKQDTSEQVAATSDTNKFLVFDGDEVKYRTGDNLRDDLDISTTDDVTFGSVTAEVTASNLQVTTGAESWPSIHHMTAEVLDAGNITGYVPWSSINIIAEGAGKGYGQLPAAFGGYIEKIIVHPTEGGVAGDFTLQLKKNNSNLGSSVTQTINASQGVLTTYTFGNSYSFSANDRLSLYVDRVDADRSKGFSFLVVFRYDLTF